MSFLTQCNCLVATRHAFYICRFSSVGFFGVGVTGGNSLDIIVGAGERGNLT